MTGYITDIQRFSTNDGPGIRTMVYFAGCGMRCLWCQNPETQQMKRLLMYDRSRCIGCGACAEACPRGANVRDADGAFIPVRETCVNCFACVPVCYNEARKPSYREVTAEEVFAEVRKDEVFYRQSGGGVTLSGGEALLQKEFAAELLGMLKKNGIGTAVETAGYYDRDNITRSAPATDLFLFDLKFIDGEKHKKYTGVSNKKILENFEFAASCCQTVLRIALIPGVNDGREFERIAEFGRKFKNVRELHILPFHNLGDYKYGQLGREYAMKGKSTENAAEIKRCAAFAENLGFDVSVGGAGVYRGYR